MFERDPRVYFLVFIIFVLCVISTPATAFAPVFFYSLLLLIILRIYAVPLSEVLRGSLAVLPAVLILGAIMFFTRRGLLDRSLAFWNIASKSYLVAVGALSYVNLAGSCRPAERGQLNKGDLRAIFAMLIILAEIRLLGG